jgi:hypothetical protein
MIEIKVQLQGCPRLSISADAEGLSDFLSSVRYVARRLDDVMYTSEEWHGELSASSVTDTEGRICERFDLFPDARAAEDFSRVVCADEGHGGFSAGIVASSAWYLHFAQEIQQLVDSAGPECCYEVASKVIYQTYKEAEADGDMLIQVQKI